jgi:hypothetical protein
VNFIGTIPNKNSLLLLLLSIVVTSLYVFTKSNSYFGQVFFGNSKVIIFILGYILVFYILYYKHVSLKMISNCMIAAGVLFVATIIIYYWKAGYIRGILSERIGTHVDIRPNAIAMSLDMIFPIAFFTAIYTKNKIVKPVLLLVSFLFLITLFLTYSRGSYLGLIALGIYLFFNKMKFYKMVIFLIVAILSFTFLYEGLL